MGGDFQNKSVLFIAMLVENAFPSLVPAGRGGPMAEMDKYRRRSRLKGICSQLVEKYNLADNDLAVETIYTILQASRTSRSQYLAQAQNLVHHTFSNRCKQWMQLVTNFPERHTDKILGLL